MKSIIVDLSPPAEAPAPVYPSPDANGISSVLALSWESGQDQWCAPEDLTYVVYGGPTAPPTDLLYEGSQLFAPVANIPLNAPYYWQVTVKDQTGHQTQGAVHSFTTWNALIPDFILAPTGSFLMGSPEGEWNRSSSEEQHEVTFSRSFFVATTEFEYGHLLSAMQWAYDNGYVTVDAGASYDVSDGNPILFDLFSDNTSRLIFQSGHFIIKRWPPERILDHVSWYEATIICDWLNFQAGLAPLYFRGDDWVCNGGDVYGANGFRLATEAEWEYCCRGGSNTAFANGEISKQHECWDVGLNEIGIYCGNYQEWHVIPAVKAPNGWGIYDMHGGMSEWCYDWKGDYPSFAVTDPVNVQYSEDDPYSQWKVLRAGQAVQPVFNYRVRSASRNSIPVDGYSSGCSLRLVRSFGDAGDHRFK